MLVTYLGHSCYSILAGELHVLVDPLLVDPFMGGIAEVFPPRRIYFEDMPKPDAVIITHYHAGHLEIDSLACLPRDTVLFYPRDVVIERVLQAMGFVNRNPVAAGQFVQSGGARLTFTGSGLAFPSIGVVIATPDGTFWLMGDRGDTLPTDQVRDITNKHGDVDFLVCSHPSDNHSFFTNMGYECGGFDGDTHQAWLARCVKTVSTVAAKLVAPATVGFRYIGDAAFLNRCLFPMLAEEFVGVLGRALPGQAATALKPGDVVEIAGRACTHHAGAAPCVTTEALPELRGLDPTIPLPAVRDSDPEQVGRIELERRVAEFLEGEFATWLEQSEGHYGELRRQYRSIGVGYRVSVQFPDGAEGSWLFLLTPDTVSTARKAGPVPAEYQQFHLRIPASTLDRWVRNVIPYFVAAPDCRRYGQIHAMGMMASGAMHVEPAPAKDLLSLYLMRDAENTLSHWLAACIQSAGTIEPTQTWL